MKNNPIKDIDSEIIYKAIKDGVFFASSWPDQRDVYEAIAEGVRRGIWDIATNATGMPTADFYDSIKDGVEEAVRGTKNG